MKWRSPFSMALLAIIAVPAVLTAYPRMTLFVPDNLADVGGWRLTITSDSAYEDVSLAGWIRADNQLVYDCTTHTFDLSPGTRTLHLSDVRIRWDWAASGYTVFKVRTGTVPEGMYDYGVTLVPFGVTATGRRDVRLPGAVRLSSPRDGDTISDPSPMFSWTRPMPAPRGPVTYALKIVEVLPGQGAEEAMRSNPPWFEQTGITATQFRYPVSARGLRGSERVYARKGSGPDTTEPGWRGPWDYDVEEQPSNTGSIKGKVTDRRTGEVLSRGVTPDTASSDTVPTDTMPYSVRSNRITSISEQFAWQVTATSPDGATTSSEVWSFRAGLLAAPRTLKWWQCDRDKGHFWQGTEEQRRCPVKGCGGGGEGFEPPDLAQLYWNGDSLVVKVHVKQEMTVREVKVVVSWVSKNGRQAADAVLLRTYDPPEERHLCDTLMLRAAWPSEFQPTGSIRPPAKDKLKLDRFRMKAMVNGQVIAENRLPAAAPPE